MKFEVCLLSPEIVNTFKERYNTENDSCKELLFVCWKILKLAADPTETEALDRVIEANIPNRVKKPKPKVQSKRPPGVDSNNPQSAAFLHVLAERAEKRTGDVYFNLEP